MNFDHASFARLWEKTVWENSDEIDPNNEFVWRGVAIGWAMGQGMNIAQATEFANYLNVHDLI